MHENNVGGNEVEMMEIDIPPVGTQMQNILNYKVKLPACIFAYVRTCVYPVFMCLKCMYLGTHKNVNKWVTSHSAKHICIV